MENIEEYVKSWSECVNVLSDLFEEHKNNPYALNKMSAYVGNLTSFINKTLKEKEEKDKEREKINKEKDIFITKFLKIKKNKLVNIKKTASTFSINLAFINLLKYAPIITKITAGIPIVIISFLSTPFLKTAILVILLET